MGLYYVAHRLFSAHDRALGAYVARSLAHRVGAEAVFLPFCDTDEEGLTDACKGRRLFELDSERLRRIDGMLALLHGPSLDDGVCMEIGYAAALGVPVVVLTTDFQTYGLFGGGPVLAFPDPLLDILVSKVVRVHRLAPPPADTGDRFEAFLLRNLGPVRAATDQAITALLGARRRNAARATTAVAGQRRVFIEPSPYLARDLWRDAANLLTTHGWDVHAATRFGESADPRGAAQTDWTAAWDAKLTLIDASGPETPPGAALITGACAATGRLVLAVEPGGVWTFADGREPNWRNLMIQYAISDRFTTIAELSALVDLG
jgi:Nucleoside 2-deoxyribosyltransferase